jgi:hypothetical protein
MPHGAIVLSYDRAIGRAWFDRNTVIDITEFNITGSRMTIDTGRSSGRVDFTA